MDEKLDYLTHYLLDERNEDYDYASLSLEDKKSLYRALVNVRLPKKASNEFLNVQDEYLELVLKEKGIVDINSLEEIEPNIYLYLGDITRINSDVIVNAGNDGGLGCFVPNHSCIDNAIHTFSGIQLREECNQILKGKELATGEIIVCNAYNLPCKKVITTVGPQIKGTVTKDDELKLSKCYRKSLEYAVANNYKSITFPSISTGLYGYPISLAKHIAYKTVKEFLKNNKIKVIFNLFSKEDYDEYREVFEN